MFGRDRVTCVTEFPWEKLRRAPDVEAPNLFAHDATDRLLAEQALALAAEHGVAGEEIAVIGDEYGAITLRLTDAGLTGIRVHQDLATGRRALERNARALGIEGFVPCELDASLLRGATLVLLQLPKSLAELAEIADAVARWAEPEVTLIAGGRVKHMTLAQNEALARCFGAVQPQRADQKSRLIVASGPLPVPEEPPFPVFAEHEGLILAAHGGAFAGPRLDIGTRALLATLHARQQLRKDAPGTAETRQNRAETADSSGVRHTDTYTAIDLGCGTGALAAAYAVLDPPARIVATDRSAAAVRSAQATMRANHLEDRVIVTHDDAGSELPDASADLILLNPPFHLGTSVHKGAAIRLFEASARLLRPGGELLAVWNSHLAYRPQLERVVGETEQLHRTPKFTVTRSVRGGGR